ncbi:MAG: DUF6268 family outer membrane beta-barrel protein [Schleiferiaceae bacterium]|nr:DUF6268 family outer membrane beta-barrel protein [Schleiferiaceae bacterium]
MRHNYLYILLLSLFMLPAWGQVTEEEEDEEDYDLYGELDFAAEGGKSYANAKINGHSPQRFVSVGYDYVFPYSTEFSSIKDGGFAVDEAGDAVETGRARYTGAYRLNANIPVISRNNILWQLGVNYLQTDYSIDTDDGSTNPDAVVGMGDILSNNSLRTMGLFTTLYKPLNEKQFLLLQLTGDLSGDFGFGNIQSLAYTRYSGALLWGKRPHDRLQWAVGMSRTYRVGNMNYIPVVMYNWTSRTGKWGTEILFPARGAVRYKINNKNLLFFGFDLEGNSYRIQELSDNLQNPSGDKNSFEIRRGELRIRFDYHRQLSNFFWLGLQAGVRIDYSFDADNLVGNETRTDIFRGFFGDQKFAMRNNLGPAPFVSLTFNFVSP